MEKLALKALAFFVLAVMGISCRKDRSSTEDRSQFKIVKKVASSATDYVQYEYNASGHVSRYVSQWQGAGGLLRLDNRLEYNAAGQLVKWENEAGAGHYTYQNGQLRQSEHFAANGKKISTLHYTFDTANRLTNVVEDIANPVGGGPIQTSISYQYYANGNLRRMDFAHRERITDPFIIHFSKKFVAYDNKKNPEPDGILGGILPGVTLLYNNPTRIENLAADGTVQGYLRYEYTYNADGFPTQRKQYIATNNVEEPPLHFTYEYWCGLIDAGRKLPINTCIWWPNLFMFTGMENTFTIYIDALNEQWEMPDSLAIQWQQYESENPVGAHNADKIHLDWYNTLSAEDKQKISRHTPQP